VAEAIERAFAAADFELVAIIPQKVADGCPLFSASRPGATTYSIRADDSRRSVGRRFLNAVFLIGPGHGLAEQPLGAATANFPVI
jgi:hypothetical protein